MVKGVSKFIFAKSYLVLNHSGYKFGFFIQNFQVTYSALRYLLETSVNKALKKLQ